MKFGELLLDGWAGVTRHRVAILRETPQRYHVRAVERMRIPGRELQPGDEALVPKRSVRIEESGK